MSLTAAAITAPGPLLSDPAPWAPTHYTPPLAPTFPSDGPRLVRLLERYWRTPDGRPLVLDAWQKALFTHLLERYPDGHPLAGELRYRQVVVSLGRQNGKSLLAGGLALYGLLQHVGAPSVVGLATSVEQARVIYDRVAFAVRSSPALKQRLKPTGTRGISRRDGRGGYRTFPALAEGLQSVPVTLGIADELHLMRPAVWDSIVNGQRAQHDALLAGITTAGDSSSTLLARLYRDGHAAIADPAGDERFGFFLWCAPDPPHIDDDAHVIAANPSVACGRVPLERVRADARKLPEPDQRRYLFNLFVEQIAGGWAPMDRWRDNAGHTIPTGVDDRRLVFGLARSEAWEYATCIAAAPTDAGIVTEAVASLARPDRGQLIALAERLLEAHPGAAVALEGSTLSNVGKELRDRGHEVWILSATEMAQAAAAAYAGIVGGRLLHAGDDLLTRQLPTVKRTYTASGAWRVIPGAGDADAVMATLAGAYVAEVRPEPAELLM